MTTCLTALAWPEMARIRVRVLDPGRNAVAIVYRLACWILRVK